MLIVSAIIPAYDAEKWIGGVERQILLVRLVCVGALIGVVPAVFYWRYVLPDRLRFKILWAVRMANLRT